MSGDGGTGGGTGRIVAHKVVLEQGAELLESWRITVEGTLPDGREVEGVLILEWSGGERFYYGSLDTGLHCEGRPAGQAEHREAVRLFQGSDSERRALEGIQRLASHHEEAPDRAAALVQAIDDHLARPGSAH